MTEERWPRLKALVAEALELPPRERLAFVEAETDGDEELLLRAESMLALEDDAAAVFDVPVADDPDPWVPELGPLATGTRVGRYRI